jgi:hypothetical protein
MSHFLPITSQLHQIADIVRYLLLQCYKCAQRGGREAHSTRCGEDHEFQFIFTQFPCSVCKNKLGGDDSYLSCQTCAEKHTERTVIVSAFTYFTLLSAAALLFVTAILRTDLVYHIVHGMC